jgi:DNA polymerase-3 subunit delta'
MEIFWLENLVENWRSARDQGRAPHAVLLTGAAGSGKRCLAAWLATEHLKAETARRLPSFPLEIPEFADLRWITIPEDKRSIGIDQIRGLVGELNLTSYEGRGKVAVIEPADAMTTSAANSLLKTLEEPPGNALIVLVADRPGRLPATIFSRCQRIGVKLPAEDQAVRWLQSLRPAENWVRVVRDNGGAPLAALAAMEHLEETNAMERDFRALPTGAAQPLEVAARWAETDPQFVLHWLSRQVQACITRACDAGGQGAPAPVDESVLRRMDRRNLFCYLDIINGLRGQAPGSFNVQLTLECLLIDWSECLRSLGDEQAVRV